MCNLKTH